MAEQASYKTLCAADQAEFTVQKSRFIGYGAPVADEQAALDFLAAVRAEHKGASHHCYAYIVGLNRGIMRYSDDGEPGGTAGMPILGVMQARELVNAAVVVVRYFGGVLLGAGGLTRAYAQGSAAALDAARVVTMVRSQRFAAEIAYPHWDKALHALSAFPCVVEDQAFTDRVTATLLTREADAEGLAKLLAQVTDGQAQLRMIDEGYEGWPE